MKILVVGSGGREHAIVRALRKSGRAEEIFVLPGNGGMKDDATLVPIGAKDIPAIMEFAAANKVDYAVVAPDDPLVLGAVDALESVGVPCFGPRKNAAIIEGSKAFSKELMKNTAYRPRSTKLSTTSRSRVPILTLCPRTGKSSSRRTGLRSARASSSRKTARKRRRRRSR